LINGVQKPAPSIVSQNVKKYEELFSHVLPYYLELNGFFTTSINGVQEADLQH